MSTEKIEKFSVDVDATDIEDLHRRLHRARWPDQVNDENWSYGTDMDYLKQLVDYWRNGFNWEQQQAFLNSFNH